MSSAKPTTDEECAQPGTRQEMDPVPPAHRKKLWVIVGMVGLALVLGGVGGVIGGFIVRATVDDDDYSSSNGPDVSIAPPNDITRAELSQFLSSRITNEVLFDDPTSPQSQAFEWLLRDLTTPGAVRATDLSKLQRYVLATIYYSTNGDGWSRPPDFGTHEVEDLEIPGLHSLGGSQWLALDPECDWTGVSCNVDHIITALVLRATEMSGLIPPDISLLSDLASLDLAQNRLSGAIPSELGMMLKLHTLCLGNRLTGTIPKELGQLTPLVDLSLAHNKLSGSIPTELGFLTSIERLDLKDNLLNGDIPSELGMLQYAKFIELFGNEFSGAVVPTEVCNLRNLELYTDCGDVEKVVCCCCEMCCEMDTEGWGCSSFNPCDKDENDDLPEVCSVCFA